MVLHQQVQGADLVPHQTRDPLQRGQPLLKSPGPIGLEENVSNVISSQDIGGSVREGLPERCPGLQTFALGLAELGGSTDRHPLNGRICLHRQTVADGVDRHLTHGGLARPNGRHGVDPTPQVDPADEVSSIDRDELCEG